LWVSDTGNNRVLRYPLALLQKGQNAPAADLVIGQNDFVSRTQATSVTSKTNLLQPLGLSFDSTGHLLVVDSGRRVLVYPTGVATNGVALRIMGLDPAVATSGQQSAISLSFPFGVTGTSAGIVCHCVEAPAQADG
ncbi:MAG: hypothetical protein WCO75_08690, partial [Planctomycetota bacterium]